MSNNNLVNPKQASRAILDQSIHNDEMEDTTIFAQGQEAVFVSKDGNCYPSAEQSNPSGREDRRQVLQQGGKLDQSIRNSKVKGVTMYAQGQNARAYGVDVGGQERLANGTKEFSQIKQNTSYGGTSRAPNRASRSKTESFQDFKSGKAPPPYGADDETRRSKVSKIPGDSKRYPEPPQQSPKYPSMTRAP